MAVAPLSDRGGEHRVHRRCCHGSAPERAHSPHQINKQTNKQKRTIYERVIRFETPCLDLDPSPALFKHAYIYIVRVYVCLLRPRMDGKSLARRRFQRSQTHDRRARRRKTTTATTTKTTTTTTTTTMTATTAATRDQDDSDDDRGLE